MQKSIVQLDTLRRIRKHLTAEKAKLLANAFTNSQFNYSPLIWMFANKSSIDKILKIHQRTLGKTKNYLMKINASIG